jgi:DNA repair exonuclease SbcCD nuclease subunit
MKFLWLGDPHVQASNLDESEKLLHFVNDMAATHKIDEIVIPGDLLHTFSILRVEVVNFWRDWLETLAARCPVSVLVGNHDKKNQSNDDDTENALEVFDLVKSVCRINIVQYPSRFGPFGYIPYIHDKGRFVETANALVTQGARTLFVHGEFLGGKFESGMYLPDGVNPDDVNCDLMVSGHIHSRQRFGKVIYPGTARWLTSSDKNEPKGLWLAEFDDLTGAILSEQFLDTSHVCTPIYAYQYLEGQEEPVIPEGSRASVELVGSSEWVQKQKVKFKGRASISSKITDKTRAVNRKVGNGLQHFVENVFEPIQGFKKERLMDLMKEWGIL